MSVGQAPVPSKPRRRRAVRRALAAAAVVVAAVLIWRGTQEESPPVEGPDSGDVAQLVRESPGGERCGLRAATTGPDAWPPACWRPYGDSSPFNQRLPAHPRLISNSRHVVERLTAFGPPVN